MIEKSKRLTLFGVLFFLFLAVPRLSGQTKPLDSISVRQDFSLPDPTYYEAFYDVKSNMYFLYPKIGNVVTGNPIAMTPGQYSAYQLSSQLKNYYREKSDNNNLVYRKDQEEAVKKGLIPSLTVRSAFFENIFGSNKIELIPQGFASFDLGGLYQKIENPLILPQNRSSFAINIQQRIQLGLLGKVGENLQLRANYDTQSGFAFENRMNLVWQSMGTWRDLQNKALGAKDGGEDKIIKRVEFGNVNMPLSTSLIRGSESLFGLKTEFQLGKTLGTLVLSQQQGEGRNILVQGGGVLNTFKINAIDYEDNQHYFLGQYFFENYDEALQNYPLINSKISINRLEVWVLDQGSGNFQEQKSILGIRDLGEGNSTGIYPENAQNNLYGQILDLGAGIRDVNAVYNTINGQTLTYASGTAETYRDGENFIFNRRARRLNSNEFTYNSQLGYLSLNQRLNDNQLLAVSFSYTVSGSPKVYKVGEFSEESSVIVTKLLKPNVLVKTTSPMWNLMMKNIYSLNANQVDSNNFLLNVYYRDPESGRVNYLPNTPLENENLLKVLNWDRLNMNNDLQLNGTIAGDGLFDFVPGITVDPVNGRLIFTKAQPFGEYLQQQLGGYDQKYVFRELYTEQKQVASQNNLALRYTLEGRYKGGQSQGISLGAINVPRGSVKVTANGVQLVEGQDYTVDYMLGQVIIINEAVKQSGQALNISLENQLTFNTQRKSFIGLNLERQMTPNLLLGATVVNYSEKPLTQKVQLGDESVNNTMAGLNLLYSNEAPFLTRLTDKIPLINTEAPSSINIRAEAAYLIPGQNKGINDQSYIDDFEQSTSKISLKEPVMWTLASKPEKNFNDPVFNGAGIYNNIQNGNGRGLLTWYNIDPRFYGIGGKAPSGINAEAVSNHASRRVMMSELYNNRDFIAGEQTFTNTFDLSYFPQERGPYNLNPSQESTQERWAGLMRPVSVSNFVNSNIEYVEFWMMDPYADGNTLGAAPELLLHLGNVSEDVLKDGKLQYENGLPTPNVPVKTSSTNWGIQPDQFPVLYAFSTEGAERTAQDVGYDGLDNQAESTFFNSTFVNPVTQQLDPAADDFVYYLSDRFNGPAASSLIERYKYFRNPDGNSQSNSLEVSSQTPDAEDTNRDYNLDQNENYNQYTVSLRKEDLTLGQNFIVDVKEVNAKFQNGQTSKNKWFLFRIPVLQFDTDAGDFDASILNNVRFARMLLKGFDQKSTLRFGTMDLVRSEWRKYTRNVASGTVSEEGNQLIDTENFDVGSVNLEENALGTPPYVIPPGIERQVLSGNAGAQRQNEASLYLKALGIQNSGSGADATRAVFKNTALDMRRYKNLELFIHAENLRDRNASYLDENAKFFIRLGSDGTDNYYEYETSLTYTSVNAKTPFEIWPQENMVNLSVQDLVEAKSRRDRSGISIIERTQDAQFGDENKRIFVKGRPSLGNITTIMMGVRNNSAIAKDIVLWVNEIRLSGIENEGGYAGNASVDFNLGDFATVNTNGSLSTIGFGFIDQKPVERSQSSNSAFNINTTVNVDKFIPEKVGMKIPVNYSYTQVVEDPKYNPIDNDIEFSKSENKEELKKTARTFSQQRSIGVLNMRKDRMNPNRTARFYDVENLSLTALYSDDYYRDIYTSQNYRQYLRGYLDYNFNFKPFVVRPFNKLVSDTARSAKYLRWLKEFNLNPLPTRVSFRTEIDRNFNQFEYRNIESLLNGTQSLAFDPIRNQNFFFGWQYNVGFNLTKNLKLDVNSNTRTLNDHLAAQNMTTRSIFENPLRVGRPVLYNHRVQANYRLPFEYLPYLDFVNAEVGYGFQYNWHARTSVLPGDLRADIGNVSQNTNNINATASLDFPSFLNKFEGYRKIAETMQKRSAETDSLNNVYTRAFANPNSKRKFPSYRYKNRLSVGQGLIYALTSFKQMDVSYTENNGSVLPGIISSPNFYGYGQQIGGPTMGFLVGSQADIRRYAIENGWITQSDLMNDPYSRLNNKVLTANLQVMPVNDLRIDLNVLKNYNSNFFHGGYNVDVNPDTPFHDFSFANELITYSFSDVIFGSGFNSANLFENLTRNAQKLSQQYGQADASGYAPGYSLANAYIAVPAFRAAVSGRGANEVGNPTKAGLPLPNWRVTYSGLRNVPFINSQFSKFELLHGYNSSYTASGIQSNIEYYNNPNGVDARGDRVNPYLFSQVGYVEEFAPLVGADLTMRNNIQFRAMYNRSRFMMLGLVNNTLTADFSNEYVAGFGYILKDLPLNIRLKGSNRKIKSDLNIRGDFSLRDSKTDITNLLLADSQVTGGQRLLGLKVTADYSMSQNFNLRFFYDQLMTQYKISTAFPLSTVRAGLTATFTFGGSGY